MKKRKVSLSLPTALVERIDELAQCARLTRSECAARLMTATIGDASRAVVGSRDGELLACAYAVHAMLQWYLPQAFGETQGRAEMVEGMSLCDNAEFFQEIGRSMAGNGGNLAAALADAASSANGFQLDWAANDFEGRADFASYYRETAAQVESERAHRAEGRRRDGREG